MRRLSLSGPTFPTHRSECCPENWFVRIKPSGFTKASGVMEMMTHEPSRGRRPLFIGAHVTDATRVCAIMPDMRACLSVAAVPGRGPYLSIA